MSNILFWLYILNAILIIVHEIESAYWEEWKLFRLPGGLTVFLLLHFPILFFILFGLVLVFIGSFSGLICSAVLSLGGMFAFFIHTYFSRRGNGGFDLPISTFILYAILCCSILLAGVSVFEAAKLFTP